MLCNYNTEHLYQENYAELYSALKFACRIADDTWTFEDSISPPPEMGDTNVMKIISSV